MGRITSDSSSLRLAVIACAVSLIALALMAFTPAQAQAADMYRLYNPNSGEHFYTASAVEREAVRSAGWNDEGYAWTAPVRSNTPVFRLYSGTDHHYTTSAGERDSLQSVGWSYEGIGWYSDDAKGIPLYRQYNPNVDPNAPTNNSGSHNYTTSLAEHNSLVSIGWQGEGIAWYGCKAGVPAPKPTPKPEPVEDVVAIPEFDLFSATTDEITFSVEPDYSHAVTYTFEVYADAAMKNRVKTSSGCNELYTADGLTPDTTYFVRVKAVGGNKESKWTTLARFSTKGNIPTANSYTIRYNPNFSGASYPAVTQTAERNYYETIKGNPFVRDGYSFVSWNTKADGTGTDYFRNAFIWNVANAGATLDLYAIWHETPTSYTIQFRGNGGTGYMNDQAIEYDSLTNLTKCTFTRTNYVFKGWATSPSASTATYKDEESVFNIASAGDSLLLYAVWEYVAPQYTIKFDPNSTDGTVTYNGSQGARVPDQNMGINTTELLTSDQYENDKYDFTGWNTRADGTGASYAKGASVRNLANAGGTVTLYAQWKLKTYTIHFDANGGTGSMPDMVVGVYEERNLDLNKFTWANHTFKYWETIGGTSSSNRYYYDGRNVIHVAEAGETVTLRACWDEQTYTIQFDPGDEGLGASYTQKVSRGSYQKLEANRFDSSDQIALGAYEFAGWNTDRSGNGTAYEDGAYVFNLANPGSTTILYAQWKWVGKPFTITFMPNGGMGTSYTQEYMYLASTGDDPLTPNRFTRAGYFFTGWGRSPSGNTVVYQDGGVFYQSEQTSGITLYAQWHQESAAPTSYVVKYDANGGSGSMAQTWCYIDNNATLRKNEFVRANYRFKGWATQPGGGGSTYSDGQTVRNISPAMSTITLYAQWESTSAVNRNYTVYFNANGGSGSMSSRTLARDVTTTLPANTFTRTNYTFTGWSTNSSGTGSTYSDRATVKNLAAAGSSVTLYAQWTAVKGNITTPTGDQYIKPDGTKLTGWQKISDSKYRYYDANGIMVKNKEYNVTTKDSSIGAVGNATGWRGFDADGYLIFGWGFWVGDAPTKYFDTTTGVRKTGEFYMTMFNKTTKDGDPGWRYCNSSGTLMYGWQTIGSAVKYFDEAGARVHGQQYIQYDNPKTKTGSYNAWCFFTGDGSSSNQSGGARSYGITTMKQNGISIQKYYDANGKRVVGQKYLTYSNPKTNTGAFNAWVWLKGTNNKTDMNGGVLSKGWEGVPQNGKTVTKYYDASGKRLTGKQTVLYDWLDDSTRVNDPAPGRVLFDGSNASTNATGGVLHRGFSGGTYYHWDNGKETQHNTWKNAYRPSQQFAPDPDERWSADQLYAKYRSHRAANGKSQPNRMSSLDLSAESLCYNLYISREGIGKYSYTLPNGCQCVADSSTTQPFYNGYNVLNKLSATDKQKVLYQYVDGVATSVLKAPNGKWYFAIVYKMGSAPTPPAPANAMNAEERAVAVDIFNAYNRFRASKGLPQVRWTSNKVLEQDAFNDAKHIAAKGQLIHAKDPGGLKGPSDSGWRDNFSDILQYSTWKMSGAEAVARWSQSDGHRKMMQCNTATEATVGVYKDANGVWYYVIVYQRIPGTLNQSGN